MTLLLRCPSGLEFQAHPIGGEELIAIIDRSKPDAAEIDRISSVLASCFEKAVEPGPYPFIEADSTAKPPFGRMLDGDIMVAILRLWIASFPRLKGVYDFDVPCKYGGCGKLIPWSIDLAELLNNEVLYKPLSPDAFLNIAEHRPFSHKLSSTGAAVYFNLGSPSQAKPLRDLLRRENRRQATDVELVAKQIVRVDGLTEKKTGAPVTDLRGLWQWAKKLTAGDLDELLEAYQAADCGVDTEIRITCNGDDGCGREQDTDLPFGRTFWQPRSATRKGGTAKRASGETSSPESTSKPGATSSEPSAGTPTAAPASPSQS